MGSELKPARDLVHEAIRRADRRGCCNLPACAFPPRTVPWHVETMLCDELVAMLEADRAARSPSPGDAPGEWRNCEFCGCRTNAKLRACCNAGLAADAGPRKTPPTGKEPGSR